MFGGAANHDKWRTAWRCVMAIAIAALLCVCSATALGQGAPLRRPTATAPVGPLQMADTSSPRATLKSFNDACNELYAIIKSNQKFRGGSQPPPAAIQAFRCLDISHIPPAVVDGVASDTLVELKEVLDRIEIPPEKEIPDAQEMEELIEAGESASWRIPKTDITIALVTEGPRAGEYLFTQSTVDHTSQYYQRVKHISYKPDAAEGFRDWYLSEPGWMIPTTWIHALPEWTRKQWMGTAIWKWFGVVVVICLGIAFMALIYQMGRRRARIMKRIGVFRYWLTLAFPFTAMLTPLAVKWFIENQLAVTGDLRSTMTVILDMSFLITVIIVVVGALNRIAEVFISSPKIHPRGIDAQLIRLGFRVTGIAVAVIIIIEGGQQFGIPLTTLIAGAGVGGLAMALAAQDTLKNVFGSIMIILDKPYRVGERVVVKDFDGVVEEIGLRSTKIRLLTGHVAAVPNEEMARTHIENIGRRPYIRRLSDIAIPYDTPQEKVERALEIVRELLKDHEGMREEFPPRVFFTEFNRDSLNLRFIYWYHPPEYWQFLAFGERLNLQIMKAFEDDGIQFALPSNRMFLAKEEAEETEEKPFQA